MVPGMEEEIHASMQALVEMIGDFKDTKNEAEVQEHLARINGYAYALVNMGILEEKVVNGQLGIAVVTVAANRAEWLEAHKRK